jgi:hypothetical protein
MMPDVDRHEIGPNCRKSGIQPPVGDILRREGLAYCRKMNRPPES